MAFDHGEIKEYSSPQLFSIMHFSQMGVILPVEKVDGNV